MLFLLSLASSEAAVHSGAAADVITNLHEVIGQPILVALEGSASSATWLRVEGWVHAPIERISLSPADPAPQIAQALERSALPCALQLRNVRAGWEGQLVGDCGGHALPPEMALSGAPGVDDSASPLLYVAAKRSHGFRIGYAYTNDDRYFTTPHLMVIGYEVSQEISGGEGLDVLFTGNLSVSGINQSKMVPSLNLLVGMEFADALQLGVGSSINWTMPEGEVLHMLAAAGWTVSAGAFEVPLHVGYIPDVSGRDRFIVTTGVTF
jgi:hypothetical protein